MEQPYQYTGAKTKFRPKLPPAQIALAYPNGPRGAFNGPM